MVLNNLSLAGHIVNEVKVEVKTSKKDGKKISVVRNSIAVNKKIKSREYVDNVTGEVIKTENRETVLFLNFSLFGKRAENFAKFVSKGDNILFEGELQLDTVEKENNEKANYYSIYVNSIYFLDTKKSSEDVKAEENQASSTSNVLLTV